MGLMLSEYQVAAPPTKAMKRKRDQKAGSSTPAAPQFRPYSETLQSRISDWARKLLRQEYPDKGEQMRAARWSEDEFRGAGVWLVGNVNEADPEGVIFNLIEENLLLAKWMRALGISEETR